MQEAVGDKSAFAKSHTTNTHHETSEGESEQRIPLLVKYEIQRMKEDRIVAGHADYGYFQAHRMNYFKFPELVKRSKMKPPAVLSLPEVGEIPTFEDVVVTTDFIDPDERRVAVQKEASVSVSDQ